jgi:hypothetical protein
MITTKVHIQLPTHACVITVDDHTRITVFKYATTTCDWRQFSAEDSFAASDYIVEPLPRVYWGVSFPDDPPYQPY